MICLKVQHEFISSFIPINYYKKNTSNNLDNNKKIDEKKMLKDNLKNFLKLIKFLDPKINYFNNLSIIEIKNVKQLIGLDSRVNSFLAENLNKMNFNKKGLYKISPNEFFIFLFLYEKSSSCKIKHEIIEKEYGLYYVYAYEIQSKNTYSELKCTGDKEFLSIEQRVDIRNTASFLEKMSSMFKKPLPDNYNVIKNKIKQLFPLYKKIDYLCSGIKNVNVNNTSSRVSIVDVNISELEDNKYKVGDVYVYGLSEKDNRQQEERLKKIVNNNPNKISLLTQEYFDTFTCNNNDDEIFCKNVKTFISHDNQKINFQIWLSYKEYNERQIGSFMIKGSPINARYINELLQLHGVLIPGPFDQQKLSAILSIISDICGKKNEPIQPNYKYNDYGQITATIDLSSTDWKRYFDWLTGSAQLFKVDTSGIQINPFQIKFPCLNLLDTYFCTYFQPGIVISFINESKLNLPVSVNNYLTTKILDGKLNLFTDFSLFFTKRSIGLSSYKWSANDLINPLVKFGSSWNYLNDIKIKNWLILKEISSTLYLQIYKETMAEKAPYRISINNDNSTIFYQNGFEEAKFSNNNIFYFNLNDEKLNLETKNKFEIKNEFFIHYIKYISFKKNITVHTGIGITNTTNKENVLNDGTYCAFKDEVINKRFAWIAMASFNETIWTSYDLIGSPIVSFCVGILFYIRCCYGQEENKLKDLTKSIIDNARTFINCGTGIFFSIDVFGHMRITISVFINEKGKPDICFLIIYNHAILTSRLDQKLGSHMQNNTYSY